MPLLRYLTHPQVRISADIPVMRWGLSDLGRTRVNQLLTRPWLHDVRRLVSSDETKALETAALIAAHIGVPIEVREATHENDRSGTGFLPPDEFEVVADAFFANPNVSTRGWETAAVAQRRVASATADLLRAGHPEGDLLLVGHGAVGTLLKCHLTDRAISRSEDQVGGDAAPGGGNYWTYDLATRTLLHDWRALER